MRASALAALCLAACDGSTERTVLDADTADDARDVVTATDAVRAADVVTAPTDVFTATDALAATDAVTATDVFTARDATIAPTDVVPAADATAGGCASLALCDDFEDVAAGAAPSSARWTVTSPNCSGSGRIAIDDAVAHGGRRSMRVSGGGGYCDHVFAAAAMSPPVAGDELYGRMYVRLSSTLGDGHVTFATLRDAADGNRDLRLGGQSRIMMWNRESDDATLPELSPTGISRSVAPAASRWLCVEFHVDMGSGALQTWVDGAAVEGLTVDATPTADTDAQWLRRGAWRPRLIDVKLGWESYAGQTMTLWFDDVAFAARRIGCD